MHSADSVHLSISPNTVYLGAQHTDPGLRGRWLSSVLRALHLEVRHLGLDGPGVGAVPPLGEPLEQQLACRLAMGVVEHLRGENPGGTLPSGAPPGERG